MQSIGFPQDKVEKVYPEAMCFEPMLIGHFPGTRGIKLEDIENDGTYFANTKKDGVWCAYEVTDHCSYMFMRTVSTKNGLPVEKSANFPHITSFLNKVVPANTIIIGELYFPGKTAKDCITVTGCLPKKAIERQKDNPIHFYIHDMIYYNGESLMTTGALDRYLKVADLYSTFLNEKGFEGSHIELANCYKDCDLGEVALKNLSAGEEGIVMKLRDGLYYPGERPAWNTIKIKKADTVDAVIIGFVLPERDHIGSNVHWNFNINEEGNRLLGTYEDLTEKGLNPIPVTKGYYYTWKMGVEIALYKGDDLVSIGTVSSGFTDAQREAMAKMPSQFLNKVAEIGFMEKGDGTLRHPIFVRLREDKNPGDCKYEDVFNQ